jgi:hypothetical protein
MIQWGNQCIENHEAKSESACRRFVANISNWESVECVALNEAALPDTLDPYFALILDVYHSGPIPAPAERKIAYGDDAVAFENSPLQTKDRFLVGGLPVRIEYKSVDKVAEVLEIADTRTDQLWLIKDSGTYMFYRLQNGEVLFKRSAWIDSVRPARYLPDEFWIQMPRPPVQNGAFPQRPRGGLMQGDDSTTSFPRPASSRTPAPAVLREQALRTLPPRLLREVRRFPSCR